MLSLLLQLDGEVHCPACTISDLIAGPFSDAAIKAHCILAGMNPSSSADCRRRLTKKAQIQALQFCPLPHQHLPSGCPARSGSGTAGRPGQCAPPSSQGSAWLGIKTEPASASCTRSPHDPCTILLWGLAPPLTNTVHLNNV